MIRAGTTYVIVNHNTGTVLDCNTGNGWVRAWGQNGGDNQKWVLDRDGPGRPWSLRNVETGQFLAPEYGSTSAGSALRTEPEPYHWHLIDDDGDSYRIQPPGGLNIDVENADRDDDAKILLWHRKGDNQRWYFREA